MQFVLDRCGLKRWITIAQLRSVLSKKKSGQPLPVSGPDNSLSGRTGASLDHGCAGDVLSMVSLAKNLEVPDARAVHA